MRRFPWGALLALLVGLGLGLSYSWWIAPRAIDASPSSLRADFKDQYRAAIAAAYAATGNLPRAQARLALLDDADPVQALNAQAQRVLAGSDSGGSGHADQLAALALAVDEEQNGAPVATSTSADVAAVEDVATLTFGPPASELPALETETVEPIETLELLETPLAETVSVPTARPTRTATPEPGEPFALAGQETICDPNLPDGLLQVLVLNSNRRQLAGIEIDIQWNGGQEQFFTGLKPELGNGYADYTMTPEQSYTVQLARGSDVALGITPPTCQTPEGATFFGSIKLTFKQP
jgi:hypothetical protein